jgi:O-antigen biosynthesis protein
VTHYDVSDWPGASQCMSAASFWTPIWTPPESSWLEHTPFGFWLIDVLRPRSLVELGTHNGCSFGAFCQAVRALSLESRCYGVAPWGIRTDLSEHIGNHYGAFSSLIQSSFDEARAHFADGSIDLLHLGGCASYKDVLVNFMSWRRKLSPSAVVLFHRTNPREGGAAQLWQELKRDHKHFAFEDGLGLGVLATGETTARLEYLFRSVSLPEVASQIRHAYSRLGSIISFQARRFDSDGLFQQRHTLSETTSRVAEIQSTLREQSRRLAYVEALTSAHRAAIRNCIQWDRDSDVAVPFGREIEMRTPAYEIARPEAEQEYTEPVWWYDAASPEVSIIIINFNRGDLTCDCLRHIWAHTRNRRYEIIVVDNGSSPAELKKLKEFAGSFQLLELSVNRFFAEGCNIGAEISRGRYIVFLNNDTIVTDNWLEPLIGLLETRPDVGGVGPKFLYPDGRTQEAGVFLDEQGIAIQRGKEYDFDQEAAGPVDYCSAACFATLRAIFDRVSGFDLWFEPGYYEDADLCFKIRSLGLFIYYCPLSVIHHIEHATVSSFRLEFEQAKSINRETFLYRWGSHLLARTSGREGPPPPAISFPPCPAAWHAPANAAIAVFHSPYDLIPNHRQSYLLTAASVLQKTHRVYVATDAGYSTYRLHYLARDLSLDLSHISLIKRPELNNLGPIDVFVHASESPFPSVRPLGRRNFYLCQDPFAEHAAAKLSGHLESYDCVVVESAFAQHHLRRILQTFQIDLEPQVLPPPVDNAFATNGAATHKKSAQSVIVSIGNFVPFTGKVRRQRYDIVIEGIRRLVESGVDAELHVVEPFYLRRRDTHHLGPEDMRDYKILCERYSAISKALPIHFHINAVPELVRDLLSRANVYWDTIGFGIDPLVEPEKCESSGTVVLDAMAAGCIPFVVASGALVEFVRESDSGFQYITVQELVSKTKDVLQDSARIAAVSQRAGHKARSYAGMEEFAAKWHSIARS